MTTDTFPVSICAWCHAVLRYGPEEVLISHGVCLTCLGQSGLYPVETLTDFTEADLDRLPFGLIRLDHLNRVTVYNRSESQLSKMSSESVVGRNFFTEVAPCTSVLHLQDDLDRMRQGQDSGRIAHDFVFRFDHGQQMVTLVLLWDALQRKACLLVKAVR